MNLAEFLLARIAEDEAGAKRGAAEIAADPYAWTDFPSGEWDPTRVLAECAAKRRIVERHAPEDYNTAFVGSEVIQVCTECAGGGSPGADWPCGTMRDLAAVYADHPDYRDEWRP
jgi:hypothetical protein